MMMAKKIVEGVSLFGTTKLRNEDNGDEVATFFKIKLPLEFNRKIIFMASIIAL